MEAKREDDRAVDLPSRDFSAVLTWNLDLRKKLGVPATLADLGVPESEQLTLAAIRGDLGA